MVQTGDRTNKVQKRKTWKVSSMCTRIRRERESPRKVHQSFGPFCLCQEAGRRCMVADAPSVVIMSLSQQPALRVCEV